MCSFTELILHVFIFSLFFYGFLDNRDNNKYKYYCVETQKQVPKIFSNLSFYLYGDFNEKSKLQKVELERLVECGGGKLTSSMFMLCLSVCVFFVARQTELTVCHVRVFICLFVVGVFICRS